MDIRESKDEFLKKTTEGLLKKNKHEIVGVRVFDFIGTGDFTVMAAAKFVKDGFTAYSLGFGGRETRGIGEELLDEVERMKREDLDSLMAGTANVRTRAKQECARETYEEGKHMHHFFHERRIGAEDKRKSQESPNRP